MSKHCNTFLIAKSAVKTNPMVEITPDNLKAVTGKVDKYLLQLGIKTAQITIVHDKNNAFASIKIDVNKPTPKEAQEAAFLSSAEKYGMRASDLNRVFPSVSGDGDPTETHKVIGAIPRCYVYPLVVESTSANGRKSVSRWTVASVAKRLAQPIPKAVKDAVIFAI